MKKGYPKGLGKGLGKGKGKGKKGKPGKGGYRDQQHRHVAPQLSFDGSKGKGKGKPPFKGKGKSLHNGNRGKGGAYHSHRSEMGSSSTVSSHTAITCGFCHKIGHTIDHCRKRQTLHSSTLYQQTRSKSSGRQQLLFDKLERIAHSLPIRAHGACVHLVMATIAHHRKNPCSTHKPTMPVVKKSYP